jgi:hypothetical protein
MRDEGGICSTGGRKNDREKSKFWHKYQSQCPLLGRDCPGIEVGAEL